MSEARRLLEEVPHAYKCSTYDETADVPVDDGRCDCHRVAIDAFLAQPEPAAREAALVAALRDARGMASVTLNLNASPRALEDEALRVIRVVDTALADTSPAAAALLAQGERLREALTHPTYGDLFDLAKEIHERMERGDWPRMGQMGALLYMGRQARAALAPGETE